MVKANRVLGYCRAFFGVLSNHAENRKVYISGLTLDDVIWGYRLFLKREPENDEAVTLTPMYFRNYPLF